MVGYITTAHDMAQRISEKWRHCACTSVVITFCTSLFLLAWGGRELEVYFFYSTWMDNTHPRRRFWFSPRRGAT